MFVCVFVLFVYLCFLCLILLYTSFCFVRFILISTHLFKFYMTLFNCIIPLTYMLPKQRILLLPSTTTRRTTSSAKPTTTSTTTTTTTTPKPTTTSTTTTTTSSTTRRPQPTLEQLNDLLDSFPLTTTRRPKLTTFSDADDKAFLAGLVRVLLITFLSDFFEIIYEKYLFCFLNTYRKYPLLTKI